MGRLKNCWYEWRWNGNLRAGLWALLPDRCEVSHRPIANLVCCRNGVRGNENRIATTAGWVRMCDDCVARMRHENAA